MLHCTLGSKANLEKNIEDALSRRAKCEAAIAVFDDMCSQQGAVDQAIDDSTNRMRDVVAVLKTVKQWMGRGQRRMHSFIHMSWKMRCCGMMEREGHNDGKYIETSGMSQMKTCLDCYCSITKCLERLQCP